MEIVITANEAIELGIWEQLCNLLEWNVWAVNEGAMDANQKDEARQLGLISNR